MDTVVLVTGGTPEVQAKPTKGAAYPRELMPFTNAMRIFEGTVVGDSNVLIT